MTPLKLKEDPREWRKFSLSLALFIALWSGLALWKRGVVLGAMLGLTLAILLALMALVFPRVLRQPYRFGMILGHLLGKVIGSILLTLVFFGVVTPLGFLLRTSGKDLLRLRRDSAAKTYWIHSKPPTGLDQMF